MPQWPTPTQTASAAISDARAGGNSSFLQVLYHCPERGRAFVDINLDIANDSITEGGLGRALTPIERYGRGGNADEESAACGHTSLRCRTGGRTCRCGRRIQPCANRRRGQ